MDILEAYTEIFAGLILFLASLVLLFDNIIDPAFEQIEINYSARADKAATYSVSLNEGLGVHDQAVGRTPGIDPPVGVFDERDSGMSRMYFRPEQFVMLPAVDTDVSSNPNIPLEVRRNIVSSSYDIKGTAISLVERRGLKIGLDPSMINFDYTINRDSLYDKQITYNSIDYPGLINQLRSLAVYPKTSYGTRTHYEQQLYGGFNITVDSSIHPSSGKLSNSVIFVTGRVPTK